MRVRRRAIKNWALQHPCTIINRVHHSCGERPPGGLKGPREGTDGGIDRQLVRRSVAPAKGARVGFRARASAGLVAALSRDCVKLSPVGRQLNGELSPAPGVRTEAAHGH